MSQMNTCIGCIARLLVETVSLVASSTSGDDDDEAFATSANDKMTTLQ